MRCTGLPTALSVLAAVSLAACTRGTPQAGVWTWVKGASAVGQLGTYGTRGVASPINVPGAREAQVSWMDRTGNLWIFGGTGFDSTGTFSYLNDLWKYSPIQHEWTWVGGAAQVNEAGRYGTQGVQDPRNIPGARQSAVAWHDSAGNEWMFGGYGADISGKTGYLNDLWKYSPVTGQWTWVSGSEHENTAGRYGKRGVAASGDVPGGRYLAVAWTDGAGNLWLFGGKGYDAAGKLGNLNDLWKFSPAEGRWTWVGGSEHVNAAGRYGRLGVTTPSGAPGARQGAAGWTDATRTFWMFGGIGEDANGTEGNLNDLWKFSPAEGRWTWVSGSPYVNGGGQYGRRNVPAAGNTPGARSLSITWTDPAGHLWLFGGVRTVPGGPSGYFNDIWEYSPSAGQWTWVGGTARPDLRGVYGRRATAAAANLPGARQAGAAWCDAKGHVWMFGGYGVDSVGVSGNLNDLWEYRPGKSGK
ncbi:MAG: kelch repeat-containing protein [Acidiferrobacterales bacterium]